MTAAASKLQGRKRQHITNGGKITECGGSRVKGNGSVRVWRNIKGRKESKGQSLIQSSKRR